MLAASLYIIVCSARNRLRKRLKRLREPRYLIGAIAGIAYFYFSIFARLRVRSSAARRGGPARAGAPASMQALFAAGPAIAGVILFATTAASWLMPFDSGLLDFSEPEVQFLFPAPVSRRALLVHRMLRSQLGMLFSSVIVAAVSPVTGARRIQMAIGMWLLLATTKVYFTGISLARVRLRSPSPEARRVARLPILVLLAALAIVVQAAASTWASVRPAALADWLRVLTTVSSAGASKIVLWPFVALVRPLFAASPASFLGALAGAAVVPVAVVAWVLVSDDAFEDAAADAAASRQSASTAARQTAFKARATGITLALTGRPELAFAWKAALQTLRVVDRRTVTRVAVVVAALSMASVSMGRAGGLTAILATVALAGAGFSILMAPQALRIDIRQDLAHLELLKTWPVGASAVVRGELLWPGALLTGVTWVCLALALFLSTALFRETTLLMRSSVAVAAALVAPSLIFAQLTIHNGVALMFPAWVPLGTQRARGVDAIGQRLILLGGTWVLLVVMTLPGAIAGGLVWFALRHVIGAAAFVPAALVGTAILALEVAIASEAVGPAYDRLDLTAVERVE